jgi:hypothetical protein
MRARCNIDILGGSADLSVRREFVGASWSIACFFGVPARKTSPIFSKKPKENMLDIFGLGRAAW